MAKNNKTSSVSLINSRFTTVISISLVLFLLALVMFIGLLGNQLSTFVKENITFSVILKDNQGTVAIKRTQKRLEAYPFIKSTKYISKTQAVHELKEELGEDPTSFLGYNPMKASLEVKLNSTYANSDSLPIIKEKLESFTNISNLFYRQDLMKMVDKNLHYIKQTLLVLMLILSLISFVLIHNTIQLHVNSKRFLINTMRLVGATPSFIRKPFLISNMISGFIAAMIASFMFLGLLYYSQTNYPQLLSLVKIESVLIVFTAIFVTGLLLSLIAAYFALNHFLRMSVGKMYYD